jgi:DNA repair photolyase
LAIKKIIAKSILRKYKKIDSWFISRCGMNLYRGCYHDCIYCDGRSEGYYVEGEFGKDIAVKVNAIEILLRELDPKRKRVPFRPGFIMLGGGVGDSYQPIEKKFELTRKTLYLIEGYKYPVHILTKSTLVKRDLDLIKKINKQNRAIVSFSFSSTNDQISSLYEPNIPSPSERLETMKIFKKEGIAVGMFLLPVIPFVTDSEELINEALKKARDIGIDFVIFGCMTLKPGRQSDYFYKTIKKTNPDLINLIKSIYYGDKWGQPSTEYYLSITDIYNKLTKKYGLPKRIPQTLFEDILWENDLIIVLLEHIDYLLKLEGKPSPFGYAAYSLSKYKESLSKMKNKFQSLKGIGKRTEAIILEVLETGKSSLLEKLLHS